MRASLSSSDFYRKAPPEACLTNMALIPTARPRLWPPTSLPRGDPNPLVQPYHFTAPQGAMALPLQAALGPKHSEPTTRTGWWWCRRGGTTVTRGAHNVWTQSPAHDKPAMHSHTCTHTPLRLHANTHTNTSTYPPVRSHTHQSAVELTWLSNRRSVGRWWNAKNLGLEKLLCSRFWRWRGGDGGLYVRPKDKRTREDKMEAAEWRIN